MPLTRLWLLFGLNALQLLYTDETNLDPTTSEFFLYAGVAIPADSAAELSRAIWKLRLRYGYKPADLLKFNAAGRPKGVTFEQHRDLKRDVMKAVAKSGSRLLANFVLHKIAVKTHQARLYGINTICFHFDCYLNWCKDYGLVLIDQFADKDLAPLLREKFSTGVELPYTPKYGLSRVLGFHVAAIGTSQFCSVADIVLGSLRFALGSFLSGRNIETASELLSQLAPLCIRNPVGEPLVSELSVSFSPRRVKVAKYRERYSALKAFLGDGGIQMAQLLD